MASRAHGQQRRQQQPLLYRHRNLLPIRRRQRPLPPLTSREATSLSSHEAPSRHAPAMSTAAQAAARGSSRQAACSACCAPSQGVSWAKPGGASCPCAWPRLAPPDAPGSPRLPYAPASRVPAYRRPSSSSAAAGMAAISCAAAPLPSASRSACSALATQPTASGRCPSAGNAPCGCSTLNQVMLLAGPALLRLYGPTMAAGRGWCWGAQSRQAGQCQRVGAPGGRPPTLRRRRRAAAGQATAGAAT